LNLEALEDRTLPSVIPAATVTANLNISPTGGNHSAPTVAVDPVNPQNMVTVYTRNDPNLGAAQPVVVEAAYSTDGGSSWTTLSMDPNLIDPLSTAKPPAVFPQATDASVAFDRNDNFYVVYSEHEAAQGSGAIVLEKFNLSSGVLSRDTTVQDVLYEWTSDAAITPVVAVDNNVPSYTDPTSGVVQSDPYSGNVYVAWATINTPPPGVTSGFNPNSIKLVDSSDGGLTFSTQIYVNNNRNTGNEHDAAPQLVVSQGTPDGRVAPGQVTVVYDDFGSDKLATPIPFDDIRVNRVSGAYELSTSGTTGTIGDAGPGTPNSPVTTKFFVNINPPSSFTTVTDLNVALSLVHPALSELSATLVAPDGKTAAVLFQNQTNSSGVTNTNIGISGANLGDPSGNASLSTVFDDTAARNIHVGTAPYTGHFQSELVDLNVFFGMTAAQIKGQWTLELTDYRNDGTPPTQFVRSWSITMTSGMTALSGTGAVDATTSPILGAISAPFPLTAAVSPELGIGAAPVIAADNTLGSFSPNQGNIYVAYVGRLPLTLGPMGPSNGNETDNTDIFLITSHDGGITWSGPTQMNTDTAVVDGFSEADNNPFTGHISGRPQFEPALAVDQSTGTLVATWYDARQDAARARVARYITASIDGGQSFNAQTFLNTPETAFDEITRQTDILGPIPDNFSSGNGNRDKVFAEGQRQGLAVNDGHVIAVWTGNENGGFDGKEKINILAATAVIAAGPRIISSTQGPVSDPINVDFASDGTRLADTFDVTFDRPVDPGTFTPAAVTVLFNDADPTNTTPVTLTVLSVTPIVGATQFQIKFDPSAALALDGTYIGTYSYSIAPVIQDRIRTVSTTGNLMDQDADGLAGNPNADAYSIPKPLLGTLPFQGPFDQTTEPLVVPGPHVIQTQVVGNPITPDNEVLNGTVSSIDVTFDRNINPASFTPSQILRMVGPAGSIGPNGAIPASFTITPNPNGTDPDPNNPRTYRINFMSPDGTTPLVFSSNGTYVVTIGSGIQAASGNLPNAPALLDTNLNAGLDKLNQIPASTITVAYKSADTPKTVGGATAGTLTDSTLNVADNYLLQNVTVQLDITYSHDPDLEAFLIAPNGTRIELFAKVGANGTQANFTGTIFDDTAVPPTSITAGAPPFTGRFNPQVGTGQDLSSLFNTSSMGAWTLEIKDDVAGTTGTLTDWTLTLTKPLPNTGLGEPVADQTMASFRIFTMDPANPVSHSQWTSVGPALDNSGHGRIGGIAVDPSDPSGNTVYVAGASGGIWKTTDFLTTASGGPTYVPLTDFGPTFGINIGGLAVFARNNDTTQSVVFAATGEGDTGTNGVGFLRSMDGGNTWTLLDSTTNVDANGNILPINSSARDHAFVGSNAFKVVVDPRPTPNGSIIIYAALSGKNGGIWRSIDSGNHWQLMRAGQATDIVLDPNSGHFDSIGNPTGNLDYVYAAFRGDGVYFSPNRGTVWNQILGGVGDPLIQNGDFFPNNPIPVTAPSSTPNGAHGRIVLIKPDLTGTLLPDGTYVGGDPAADLLYEGWLYAVVIDTNSHMFGIYLTKDFGQNWTKLRVPTLPPFTVGGSFPQAVPTNDTSKSDYDIGGGGNFSQGNYDVSAAIDPNNPNIIYVGGTADGQPTGLIRVDATAVSDPHAFFVDNSRNDGGTLRIASSDPVSLSNWPNPIGFFIDPIFNPVVNLIRDPFDPYNAGATQLVSNTGTFANSGANVKWIPFDIAGTDQHRFITIRDPLTGLSRLIIGDDQGIYSALDNNGVLSTGTVSGISETGGGGGDRNGNLAIAQFYYGASQPSSAAAQIAGALFYAGVQDGASDESASNVLTTGNVAWGSDGQGDGAGVATDQTGTGTFYQYKWPCCGGNGTDFFQVNEVGRTFGLLQQSLPGLTPDPQWPYLGGVNFAANPIDGNEIMISSTAGRIFGTADQGRTWVVIGNPTALDSTQSFAMAFGAPQPSDPTGALNDFLYVGTNGGHIFVTFTGGGANGNTWTNLSAGLDGSPVEAIVTNPTRGSREAYAVTLNGVYHMVDAAATGATWINITGNLFSLINNAFTPFQDSTQLTSPHLGPIASGQPQGYLDAVQADWRYAIPDNSFEVDNPQTPPGPTHPVLYVGGESGVYRSVDGGRTWTIFPDVANDGAKQDGGYLPNAHVTDLNLALGNVDPTTGHPIVLDPSTGAKAPDILLASTYGRSDFAIVVSPVIVANSLQLDPSLPSPKGSTVGPAPNNFSVLTPVLDGMSEQSAFNNTVKIELFDVTNGVANAVEIGVGIDANGNVLTDSSGNPIPYALTDSTGRFKIMVQAGYFKADGSTDGVKTFAVRATDAAGAVGNFTFFTYTLNTTPFIHADRIRFDPNSPTTPGGSDSGLLLPTPGALGTFTDQLTNIIQPFIQGFNGAVDQAAPVPIQIFDITNPKSPVLVGTGNTDASGNFDIQLNAGVYKSDGSTDGVHVLQIVSPHTPNSNAVTFTFTLETAPPPTPPAPQLSPLSDSGSSNSDHITNVTTPTFFGTAEPGDQVQLFASNVQSPNQQLVGLDLVNSVGNYSVTVSSPMTPGTYNFTIRLSDLAGNLSGMSAAATPPITITTTPPSTPTLSVDPAFITGNALTNVTAANPVRILGTTDQGTTDVLLDNGVQIDSFTQTSGNTFARLETLNLGVNSLTLVATNVAGNTATSAPLVITVDPTALDPDHKFVRQLYFDALGRTGVLAEWNLWTPILAQPNGRAIVANGIERSGEARDRLVKSWYQTYLGRPALNGEEQPWVNFFLSGATEEQVLSAILGTGEYFNRTGTLLNGPPSNTTFVQALYLQVLNRTASSGEVAFWVSQIPALGLQGVAFDFLTSIEYREDVVRGYYANLLMRPTAPAQSEVDGWAFSSLDITSIRIGFEASQEFYFRVTGFLP
jgi:subtilisin-like proprotein convertase family protein